MAIEYGSSPVEGRGAPDAVAVRPRARFRQDREVVWRLAEKGRQVGGQR
ncbi:hypothetical protein M8494_06505 [Serratia ureilytica]